MFRAAAADFKPGRAEFVVAASAIKRSASRSISWACALAVTGTIASTCLATAQTTPANAPIEFDIPSQNLAAALSAYGATSEMQVLYETSLASGKTSTAIAGRFTAEVALRVLLTGTGLASRLTDADAITIFPEKRERAGGTSAVVPDARFLGALQAGILNSLCQNAETKPGAYRMALQLWITPSGRLQQVALLGSTGDARRDGALVEQLRGVPIAVLPPRGMSQPVTLAIIPRSPLQRPECGGQ